MSHPRFADGAGPVDGHQEDNDLHLLVGGCDHRAETGNKPSDEFWDALHRRHLLLRRTAKLLGQKVPDDEDDLLDPLTIRVCSSWLLEN